LADQIGLGRLAEGGDVEGVDGREVFRAFVTDFEAGG
jgi:hypothetical protein